MERRYLDPFWMRFLDANLRGMGLTPYGPLSRLVFSMVAFGTMSQSVEEVISSFFWLGENARVLGNFIVRVLDNMPKGWEEWEELHSFSDAVTVDGSGWFFYFHRLGVVRLLSL